MKKFCKDFDNSGVDGHTMGMVESPRQEPAARMRMTSSNTNENSDREEQATVQDGRLPFNGKRWFTAQMKLPCPTDIDG